MQTSPVPSHSHTLYTAITHKTETLLQERKHILFQFFQLNYFPATDFATQTLKHSKNNALIPYLHEAKE